MNTKELTTEIVIKLEIAGGIITNATLPIEIMPDDPVDVWFEHLPLVDTKLVARWHDVYKAKTTLQFEIDRLTK